MNPETKAGPPGNDPGTDAMTEADYSAGAPESNVVLLRLLTAAMSRLAQALGRPRWAVAAVFWLEARRIKIEERGRE